LETTNVEQTKWDIRQRLGIQQNWGIYEELWGYNDVSDGFSRIETIHVASKSVRCMSFNFCFLVVVVFFGVMGKMGCG
jgi:hypothetical protein